MKFQTLNIRPTRLSKKYFWAKAQDLRLDQLDNQAGMEI
jgi:hypothetical protein